jgi:glutamate racemase
MIGVFDSGVGGLGILHEIRRRMPEADLVYLADQANAPYGERTLDEVRILAERAARRLIEFGAATVVVACNTASAAALQSLRVGFPDVGFVGMEPAVKPAAVTTRTGVVAVLATPATFQADVLDGLVDRFADGVTVLARPCPGWADLVEDPNGDEVAAVAAQVEPLVRSGADTLVIACTHYTFLADTIRAAAGPSVTVIDPAEAVARQVARVAKGSGTGATIYLTTGEPGRFAAQIARLLGETAAVRGIPAVG